VTNKTIAQNILVCGIPGSGKTTYCAWLEQKKGFLHLDFDELEKGNGTDKKLALLDCLRHSAERFLTVIARIEQPIVIDWGFPPHLDEAAADFKKALELNPDVVAAHMVLSQIFVVGRRPHDALSEIELVRYDSVRAFLYPIAYFALDRKKESDTALSELIAKYHASGAYQIADVYALRNQSDKAFEWLDRAYAQRDSNLIVTKVDPLLKSLHHDPRYAALLKKLDLPN
jgi:tetratricopeptide (TPR) repeat protein